MARWYADSQTDRYHCLFCNEIIGAMDLRSHQLDQHKYRLPEVGKSAFLKYIRREKIPVSGVSRSPRAGAIPFAILLTMVMQFFYFRWAPRCLQVLGKEQARVHTAVRRSLEDWIFSPISTWTMVREVCPNIHLLTHSLTQAFSHGLFERIARDFKHAQKRRITHYVPFAEKQFVLFDLEFDSMEEFEQWLEIITYKYMTGYTKNRTNVAQSGIKTQMYLCR